MEAAISLAVAKLNRERWEVSRGPWVEEWTWAGENARTTAGLLPQRRGPVVGGPGTGGTRLSPGVAGPIEASARSSKGLLRARRHDAVHAQILDHLPVVVVSMSRNEGCDDRPRVQTVDTVNSSVGILGSNRRERLVCIGERIRSSLQELLLRRQTVMLFGSTGIFSPRIFEAK